jgi:hypothetical protein
VAITAFAPRGAFETWLVAREGVADLEDAARDGRLAAVAARIAPAIERLRRVLGPAAVDMYLADGAPFRVVLRPRLAQRAPTPADGVAVVGVFPEEAARLLRTA